MSIYQIVPFYKKRRHIVITIPRHAGFDDHNVSFFFSCPPNGIPLGSIGEAGRGRGSGTERSGDVGG